MSRIILAERSIERLSFEGGDWVLESSAWQKVDRDIFAKAPFIAAGRDAILAMLRDIGADASITSQITKLIDRPETGPTTYVMKDGQLLLEPPREQNQKEPAPRPQAKESYGMRLEDLRAELETLRERVRYLEQFLDGVDAKYDQSSNENGFDDEQSTLDAV